MEARTLDGVWTFDNGVLVSLMPSLDQTIAAALKNILPAGCGLRPDRDGLDLVRLRVVDQVWPRDESKKDPACQGSVELKLGIRNHRFAVVDQQLAP